MNCVRRMVCAAAVLAALAGAGCTGMATSSTASLTATLSGAAEVPPNDSPGKGSLEGSYDKTTRLLRWKVSYSGLSGPLTAGHFHGPAMAGSNAGVVVPFKGGLDSPIAGEATLTDAQAADLLAGKWYVNLHTAAKPPGEIRGQVLIGP